MEKITVGITTEFITISNLLKYAGVLETGGQAHEAIECGSSYVEWCYSYGKTKESFSARILLF